MSCVKSLRLWGPQNLQLLVRHHVCIQQLSRVNLKSFATMALMHAWLPLILLYGWGWPINLQLLLRHHVCVSQLSREYDARKSVKAGFQHWLSTQSLHLEAIKRKTQILHQA